MSLTVRIKGLEEARAAIAKAEALLEPKLIEEVKAGAEIVRTAASASAGGGELGQSYTLGGQGTTVTIYSDLIYAPVQEFAVVWGREVRSRRTGKVHHQTVHYHDAAVPRHLYPALDAKGDAVAERIIEGVSRVMGADGWLGD